MDRLRGIETFIRAADLGSFYQAASVLGLTPQAVSKTIRQLESELGIVLFHRTRRQSSLTEEGRRFLARVRSGVATVTAAWEHAKHDTADLSGLIRVTAPIGVGRTLILPLLQSFQALHPDIEFDLVAEDRYTNIVTAGIDVGFRCGLEPDGQLVVQELMRMQFIACASPSYLRTHGIPQTRADLAHHFCIGSRRPNTGRVIPWEFATDEGIEFEPVHTKFCTNDVSTELEAVLGGMGIGMIDSIIGASHIRAGRLIPLLCEHVSERLGVYLYHAHQLDMPRRVQSFINHAVEHFREHSEQFRMGQEQREKFRKAFQPII